VEILLHLEKRLLGRRRTFLPIDTYERLEQLSIIPISGLLETQFSTLKNTVDKCVHLQKTFSRVSAEDGMDIDVRLLHSQKAALTIYLTEFGIDTDNNPLHFSNAAGFILFTEFLITTEVNS
jgi:hypothetical protein